MEYFENTISSTEDKNQFPNTEELSLVSVSEKKKHLNNWQICVLYFFTFAFLGWLLETLYAIFTTGGFIKRGFLYGPICPIYGYGALMLILFLGKYRNNNLKLFIYAIVVFSAFEYLVSFGMEALFSAHWWDYTNEFFNLNGRISIFFSLAWGFIAIIFINHVYPFFKKYINILIEKIPYSVQITAICLITCTFFVDNIASFIRYLF